MSLIPAGCTCKCAQSFHRWPDTQTYENREERVVGCPGHSTVVRVAFKEVIDLVFEALRGRGALCDDGLIGDSAPISNGGMSDQNMSTGHGMHTRSCTARLL